MSRPIRTSRQFIRKWLNSIYEMPSIHSGLYVFDGFCIFCVAVRECVCCYYVLRPAAAVSVCVCVFWVVALWWHWTHTAVFVQCMSMHNAQANHFLHCAMEFFAAKISQRILLIFVGTIRFDVNCCSSEWWIKWNISSFNLMSLFLSLNHLLVFQSSGCVRSTFDKHQVF